MSSAITVHPGDEEEPREVEVVHGDVIGSAALAALNRSEIDIQIQTAKRFPRSISQFKKTALAMATIDEETAGSMFYKVPRSGKTIEGPSVRLAARNAGRRPLTKKRTDECSQAP